MEPTLRERIARTIGNARRQSDSAYVATRWDEPSVCDFDAADALIREGLAGVSPSPPDRERIAEVLQAAIVDGLPDYMKESDRWFVVLNVDTRALADALIAAAAAAGLGQPPPDLNTRRTVYGRLLGAWEKAGPVDLIGLASIAADLAEEFYTEQIAGRLDAGLGQPPRTATETP